MPLGIILLQYFGRVRFPFGVPGGLLSVIVGIGLAHISGWMGDPIIDPNAFLNGKENIGFYFPQFVLADLFSVLDYTNIKAYFRLFYRWVSSM